MEWYCGLRLKVISLNITLYNRKELFVLSAACIFHDTCSGYVHWRKIRISFWHFFYTIAIWKCIKTKRFFGESSTSGFVASHHWHQNRGLVDLDLSIDLTTWIQILIFFNELQWKSTIIYRYRHTVKKPILKKIPLHYLYLVKYHLEKRDIWQLHQSFGSDFKSKSTSPYNLSVLLGRNPFNLIARYREHT